LGTPVDKICCVIYHTGEMYKKIASNAVNSFKKYHPDIQLFEVTDDNIGDYHFSKNINFSIDGIETEIDPGARKFFIAYELMKLRGYKKVICLGADTITTARLTEFIETPAGIAVTSDYPDANGFPWEHNGKMIFMQPASVNKDPNSAPIPITEFHKIYEESYKNNTLVADVGYVNADVVCFNSQEILEEVCKIWYKYRVVTLIPKYRFRLAHEVGAYDLDMPQSEINLIRNKLSEIKSPNAWDPTDQTVMVARYHYLSEQAALNIFVAPHTQEPGVIQFVDLPVFKKGVCYNVRSKGTVSHSNKNLKDFYVKDGHLFNHAHNQIKVWHYCASLSSSPKGFEGTLKEINDSFSDEVKQYFANECNCENYFNV
jgi:hypothetical protein